MIYWMSERTNRILDENNVEVVGFDPDKESEDARIYVNIAGYSTAICLGKVKGLSDEAIDRRFAAAILNMAIDFDKENNIFVNPDEVDKLYSIADTLLGSKELPKKDATSKLKCYKFSMCMKAEHSILAGSLENAEERAREWMEDIRVIQMTDGTNDDYIDMDEFVAQQPQLVNIEDV